MFEIKLQKYFFEGNTTIFLAATFSFLNPYVDGNVHAYATTLKLKKKGVTFIGENMKETSGVQVAFILKIKFQKYIFYQYRTIF